MTKTNEKCHCVCHGEHRKLEHNTKCCDEMNGFLETTNPTPDTTVEEWKEKFEKRFENIMFGGLKPDIMDFISSLLQEARTEVIRQFATGEFIQSDIAKKFAEEIRKEARDEESKKYLESLHEFMDEELPKASEKSRQEGYEVGYAQANTESGMPKSMVDCIKEEAVKAERERHIKIYKWLLGYDDFPDCPSNKRFCWREKLRKELPDDILTAIRGDK